MIRPVGGSARAFSPRKPQKAWCGKKSDAAIGNFVSFQRADQTRGGPAGQIKSTQGGAGLCHRGPAPFYGHAAKSDRSGVCGQERRGADGPGRRPAGKAAGGSGGAGRCPLSDPGRADGEGIRHCRAAGHSGNCEEAAVDVRGSAWRRYADGGSAGQQRSASRGNGGTAGGCSDCFGIRTAGIRDE